MDLGACAKSEASPATYLRECAPALLSKEAQPSHGFEKRPPTHSASEPHVCPTSGSMPNTASPTVNPEPAPALATVPATSYPGMKGLGMSAAGWSERNILKSTGLSEAAATRITIMPGSAFISGAGTSLTSRTSAAAPCLEYVTARIVTSGSGGDVRYRRCTVMFQPS